MNKRTSRIFLLAGALALSACAASRPFSNDHAQLVAAPDSVSAMLADAADRAADALENLAAVEQARGPEALVAPVGNAPVELRRAITVNWVGPVEPVTKTLADRAGYNFITLGDPPPVPIVVSVDIENRPVIEVLRSIGLQLGARGDVRVDSNRKVVEVLYPSPAGVAPEF